MTAPVDIWKMLAGIAIFLLGMNFMEESLRSLAGRRFKLILKKHTSNKFKAIGGGAFITGILQSSSIVNLLVLSMVGAGVLTMQNALSVILGANLGSTINSWLIATIGFKFNIEVFALPLAGIAGISLAFFNSERRIYKWLRFLLGFSFLFVGLAFIREGMEQAVKQTDLSRFEGYPAIVFLLLGAILTTLVQSSSVTMALTLSALYSNAISLEMAMAIVLGGEIGTTIKLFFASVRGTSVKKRVALGNFIYNLIVVVIFLALLGPVHNLITNVLGIKDNLISIVFFQSFVNFSGIILFLPFLGMLGRFLEKKYAGSDVESLFIGKVEPSHPDLALDALEKETDYFITHVLEFTRNALDAPSAVDHRMLERDFSRKSVMEQYEFVKRLHGEIHQFCIQLQQTAKSDVETVRLEQIVSAVRNTMYAAKNIKDALHDIEQARNSSNDIKFNFYQRTRDYAGQFCRNVFEHVQAEHTSFEELAALYRQTQKDYGESLRDLYREGMDSHVDEMEISTLLNFNREIYTAFKSYMFALKDYLLDEKDAQRFDELPGFIR